MSTHRTRRLRPAGVLTAITMTALLAACSAGSSDGGADSAVSDSSGSSGSSDSGSGGGTSRELGSKAAAGDMSSDVAPGDDAAPSAPELERSVISSGAVSLSTKDVARTRQAVQRIVDAQGGEVSDEQTESDEEGDTSYARLVVRVPSARFSASMEALEEAAVLRSSTRSSDDVTTEVIDTGVRVRAQEASLKRVEVLLANAESLKDIIWIESQLTDRQAELDSLKSQQSWLKDQTSLSTITVDISTQPVSATEEDTDDRPAGFLTGLEGGMRAMSATFVAVATILGALLPFAVVALVVGLPAWLVVRRRRAVAPAEVTTSDA